MVQVYCDLYSGAEVVSDAYKSGAPFGEEGWNDVAFEVQSQYITKGEEDFGLSRNQDEDAPEGSAAEEGGSATEKVIDIVEHFKLNQTPMNLALFKSYFANYVKLLREKKGADADGPWKEKMGGLFKKMCQEFDSADLYFAENYMDMEDSTQALPIFAYYKGDEPTPRFIFLKDGTKVIKC